MTEPEFWDSRPLQIVSLDLMVYGKRGLNGSSTQGDLPIHVEWLPALGLYLVHDGRHRIEQAKRLGQSTILARVA